MGTKHGFATTSWTLIEAIQGGDANERQRALGLLYELYWPPVYAFVRRTGQNREEAQESTQKFFVERVLNREIFAKADPERGRLRSLICASLKNFLVDESASARREIPIVHLSAAAVAHEEELLAADADLTAPDAFDRRWALAVMNETLRRGEAELRSEGKDKHWRTFEIRAQHPAASGTEPLPYEAFSQSLGFKNRAVAAAAYQLVRERLRQTTRIVISETVAESEAIEEELEYLLSLLS